jgi:hypothetical protein
MSVLTGSTRRNIPEDTILHSHRCKYLKSYIEHELFRCCSEGARVVVLVLEQILLLYACLLVFRGGQTEDGLSEATEKDVIGKTSVRGTQGRGGSLGLSPLPGFLGKHPQKRQQLTSILCSDLTAMSGA